MAERKKRFSGLYWQQFALTAGMVMLTLLLLGVSFFALSYNYNFTERRDELQERASLIAQVSVDYLKSGMGPGSLLTSTLGVQHWLSKLSRWQLEYRLVAPQGEGHGPMDHHIRMQFQFGF